MCIGLRRVHREAEGEEEDSSGEIERGRKDVIEGLTRGTKTRT